MTLVLPRIVVAGTRSGVGKTTVATGLMAALSRAGHRVSGHKVGPDFIDPGYHSLATGRPPRNLDTVLHGAERVAPLLAHGAAGADIAVIEGVMGLFDGRGAGDPGSTAELARLLDAPVLLVVDASSASRSVAAEVHGFATFDPSLRLAGVVLNRLGSPGHEALVREAVASTGIPVVGAIPREPAVTTPSRHLGLVPVAERRDEAHRGIDAAAALVSQHVDLEAVVRLAQAAPGLATTPWDPQAETATGHGVPASPPRIAVAGGAAFTFTYTEHLELLDAAGAEVVVVDPLHDEHLPDDTEALLLGGGFPEVHGAELAANRSLIADVQELARRGAPIVAECGGLLYLCRDVDGVEMAGILNASATFSDRLTLGYRDAELAVDGVLGTAGTQVRGHEFHRTTIDPRCGEIPAWRFPTEPGADLPHGVARLAPEGFATGNLHASYLHTAWVGTPSLPASLVRAAGARR